MFHTRKTASSDDASFTLQTIPSYEKNLAEPIERRPEVIGVTLNRYEVLMCLLGYVAAMMTLLFLFEVIKPSQLFEL